MAKSPKRKNSGILRDFKLSFIGWRKLEWLGFALWEVQSPSCHAASCSAETSQLYWYKVPNMLLFIFQKKKNTLKPHYIVKEFCNSKIFELTLKSPKSCWTLGNINDLQEQGASPNRVRWFEIYSENAESNFSCSNGASAKTNQKLLDCEIEFNRRKSFNSENSFCFCVNPFRIERLAIRCKNLQLALAQAAFLLCFEFLCMDDDNGLKVVPGKLLHFPTCSSAKAKFIFSASPLQALYLYLFWCMEYFRKQKTVFYMMIDDEIV